MIIFRPFFMLVHQSENLRSDLHTNSYCSEPFVTVLPQYLPAAFCVDEQRTSLCGERSKSWVHTRQTAWEVITREINTQILHPIAKYNSNCHHHSQLPKYEASLTWPVLCRVGLPSCASGLNLWAGWAVWCPTRWVWSVECPGRRYCRVTPLLDWPTPVESPSAAPEIMSNAEVKLPLLLVYKS